ncbi:hypothetical protein C457_10576 [Haloferax prahovense DSM 18310]|uniref:NrS-1 polymerase-like HBD domain-containing protein n=1 Tax=Haloferax prahovense (strain DSM 18310 / JCM 13924 / TL6) TaxID=1227461 RepID=M0GDF5_HALPT|nr:hypothetical protein [Haloferax prahovense]ELZ68849.1 hypothetical protein C457_10576 [Haloferax prahovense DSM 18310]
MCDEIDLDIDQLPPELREREQWVCWRSEMRDDKATKVPVNPTTGGFGSATDSVTWADLDTAVAAVESDDADGIGFVFTDDDPFVGVDLDDCRDPETGTIDDDAQAIITQLDSYTEVSPSGTGFHILVAGELPAGRNRRGSVECYGTARFFTVTGAHVAGTPTEITHRQDALVDVHREYVQPDTESTAEPPSATPPAATRDDASEPALNDEVVLTKAREAANGGKFDRLWRGQTSGYESHSEADMALCCLLAFWTGGNHPQMDRLFRDSGLYREKWDEVHYADGSTYGKKTLERAVQQTSEFYDPDTQPREDHETTTKQSVGPQSTQDKAYLAEKNRVLTERVETLEATLAEKQAYIEELEATVDRLEQRVEAVAPRDQDEDPDTESASMWERTRSWLK